MHDTWLQRLKKQQKNSLWRCRQKLSSGQGVHIKIAEQQLINFSSNDYLGLASHSKLVEAAKAAAEQYGVGSGASQLVCGHHVLHEKLEKALANFLGVDRALVFSSGYLANLSIVTTLAKRHGTIFSDKNNHASLVDAVQLSKAHAVRFKHNDLIDLKQQLAKKAGSDLIVLSDGVFSMDGDIANLPELVSLSEQYDAALVIDDAHAIGVLGHSGKGTAEHYKISADKITAQVGTFGKAFGSHGAFIAGSNELIELLIQFARGYIYTTALPPILAASSLAALKIINEEPWRREHLKTLITHFRAYAQSQNLTTSNSLTPIQSILCDDARSAMTLSDNLRQQGFLVVAMRPPTVPQNQSRLRVSLTAEHTVEQVEAMLNAVNHYLAKPRV